MPNFISQAHRSLHRRRLRSRGRRGFTLLELMAVMALAVLLATAVISSGRGTLDGITLSGAAEFARGRFSLARQIAATRNLPVETRIYQYDDGTSKGYRTVALVIPSSVSGAAADEWLTPAADLPGHVIVDSSTGQDFSTIITKAGTVAPTATSPTVLGPWSATELSTAPGALKGREYVAFRFMPDGTTDLAKNQPWCLTLRAPHAPPGATASVPAANYASLVIDPLTGRTMTFRP